MMLLTALTALAGDYTGSWTVIGSQTDQGLVPLSDQIRAQMPQCAVFQLRLVFDEKDVTVASTLVCEKNEASFDAPPGALARWERCDVQVSAAAVLEGDRLEVPVDLRARGEHHVLRRTEEAPNRVKKRRLSGACSASLDAMKATLSMHGPALHLTNEQGVLVLHRSEPLDVQAAIEAHQKR